MAKHKSVKAELLTALKALFADYKSLADSGDAGYWSLEDQMVGKQALAAIARAEGGSNYAANLLLAATDADDADTPEQVQTGEDA